MNKLLQRVFLGLWIVALGASQALSYSADTGYLQPAINTPFSQAVANLPVAVDYVFGSSVTAASGQTAITNATQLGLYFSPYETNTGTYQVNSEFERYQPFSSASNFVFNSNNLQLTATLDSGGNVAPTAYGNTNSFSGSTASFTPANLGLADASGISVGQIFVATYNNIGVVTGVTGSGGSATINVSPIMSSGTSINTFMPFEFLPAYYAATNQAQAAGDTVLHFAAVPSGVAAGQFLSFYDNTSNTDSFNLKANSSKTYAFVSKTSTTVTISPALAAADALNSGQGVFFTQPIRSGQIWSQATFKLPGWGATYLAGELTVQLPQHATAYAGSGSVSGAAANGAYGAWPAFWMRGDSVNPNSTDSSSEIDVFEFYNNILRTMADLDPNAILGSIKQGTAGVAAISMLTDYLFNPPYWDAYQGDFNQGSQYTFHNTADYSTDYQKFQFLITPDFMIWFVNGQMIKRTHYHWSSAAMPQIGINLAIGSLQNGLVTNNLFPLANTNFPMTMNIKELKIWQR